MVRQEVEKKNIQVQVYNKEMFDSKHKTPYQYNVGDYIIVKNFDVTPNVNKKLIPRFRGPYEVKKVLVHDRYLISDIEGFQITQRPFQGIFGPKNMKLWLNIE